MINKIRCFFVVSTISFFFSHISFASELPVKFPAYFGLTTGYGSTTWGQLVPTRADEYDAMLLSTPNKVNEGGWVWGAVVGFELLPTFAAEVSYQRYPDATVIFDPISVFTYDHDGATQFVTHTEVTTVLGKFMFYIPHTRVRAFSSAGVGFLHRWDELQDRVRLSPAFNVGVNYPLTERMYVDLSFNYVAGYGESELDPVQGYMPFLYAGMIMFTYHF